jgi:hypothetical protein
LLDNLCGMFRCGGGCGCGHSCGCCEASCGCDSCGSACGSGCGCNGGHSNGATEESGDVAPAAPAEAGASFRSIPPRPMADPNASIGHSRNVVRTSFVR